MQVEYQNISVSIREKAILQNVSLSLQQGVMTGVAGPNGCGKSTLIKTTFGIMPYQSGSIYVEGRLIKEIGKKALREKIGYVGQESNTTFNFLVWEVVAMGVTTKPAGRRTREVVADALAELGILELENRGIQTLSGGEKKMVFLARVIAQGADIFILDEPTNHLDICHQLFILNYLKASGKTVLIVLHDLRLAAHYCDEVYLIKDGQNFHHGKPAQVMTPENMRKVFGIEGKIVETENGNDLWINFDNLER